MAAAAPGSPGFFEVPRHRVRVQAGEIDLPIPYRDATATTVLFPAVPAVARELVAGSGLLPIRLPLGALLAITWFEYRDTGIGPYNELGISLLVTPAVRAARLPLLALLRGDSRVGFHVLHLPVTTELARSGGVELYGYPKTVNEIPLRRDEGVVEASLRDGGRDVLSMRIPIHRGLEFRMVDVTTYSVLENCLMRAVIPTDCRARVFQARGTELSLQDESHPICRTLRRLLPRPRPRWVLHVDPFRSLLPLPVLVARLPDRSAA